MCDAYSPSICGLQGLLESWRENKLSYVYYPCLFESYFHMIKLSNDIPRPEGCYAVFPGLVDEACYM